MTAIGADTLLVGKLEEDLADRKPGIISPLGSVDSPVAGPVSASGCSGVVLGIVEVIGAILQRLGLGASAEEIGLELPLFTFELFDFFVPTWPMRQQGITMATLPISDLLTELEILASQAPDFSAQLYPFLVWDRHQGD